MSLLIFLKIKLQKKTFVFSDFKQEQVTSKKSHPDVFYKMVVLKNFINFTCFPLTNILECKIL